MFILGFLSRGGWFGSNLDFFKHLVQRVNITSSKFVYLILESSSNLDSVRCTGFSSVRCLARFGFRCVRDSLLVSFEVWFGSWVWLGSAFG